MLDMTLEMRLPVKSSVVHIYMIPLFILVDPMKLLYCMENDLEEGIYFLLIQYKPKKCTFFKLIF